ncbi:MAG: sugar ABC transporter ATP-binding protein [Spirochaetota bacterium]|jgi:simple sugar transport system ATP-binding protein|uniref:sugar ABC transporter ATP-binding protein n=1 Tax=Sphaerochaeta TaxID=399320 RepID=UPI002890F636|nr:MULTISPECIES: sugar ABC transporter ATP-binding protein [Sphaerochaeta]MDT3359733.1 sugar ABC transporter ATP-binding protein [Spirochaetota bacterium]MDX9984832.1 sugar ABC transporter ATP-binding protein [Sphaerochaeta sp.]MEA5027979.1 sugar ABC transporter ATP-binding protein [Sphaerochaeta associata]NCB97093.1 sugar ABC transporter ATP-binding protein [Bacteroidia bacterium]
MAESLLKAEGIYKSFVGVQALKNVNFSIKSGEIHCLAGENGSGKSTLIKIISGVYTPDAGYIEFDGKQYTKITPIEAINKGIQVIYQDFSIFPNLTVMENLAFNSELAEGRKIVNWKRMRTIAEEAIAKINFKVDLDAYVGNLSVAEKQMIAISRALMFNTKLIIMDEPTTALTKKEVRNLFNIILKLKERGIAILFVSHKLNEVFEISDNFTILRSGELVASGSTAELDDKKFSYYMTGREFNPRRFRPVNLSEKPIFEAHHIGLPGFFEDVSFSLCRGEIIGITGLLDSGRTELALSMFGIKPIQSGSFSIDGKSVSIQSPRDAIAHNLGFVPEDRLTEGLFLSQSIADNIVISEIDRLSKRAGIVDQAKREAEIEHWVKELAIATPDPNNACQTLSGGNQQRIVLAKWLACNLDILVLNGPTVGVDIGSKHDIHGILHELASKGLGLILISDDLPEVVENCSRIIVMKAGRIVAELKAEETDEKTILSYML